MPSRTAAGKWLGRRQPAKLRPPASLPSAHPAFAARPSPRVCIVEELLHAPLTVWTSHISGRIVLIMGIGLRLRVSDLANVTGYSRFQIRGLLAEVFQDPPLGRKSGSQQTFSPQELLVVAVVCEIEKIFGVGRKRLALVSEALRATLTGPRSVNRGAKLLLTFAPPAAKYLDDDVGVIEGLVVQLGPKFAKVDEYLGVSGTAYTSLQAELPMHPVIATARGGSRQQ
jgi:hypothetical protein